LRLSQLILRNKIGKSAKNKLKPLSA
jgi:hypothetical protein